jgi:hypothetical protein
VLYAHSVTWWCVIASAKLSEREIHGCRAALLLLLVVGYASSCLRRHAMLLHAAADPLLNALQHHLHWQYTLKQLAS